MANAIKTNFGQGGANVGPGSTAGSDPDLATVLRGVADDLKTLRDHFIELLVKLDANHAAAADHEATLTPAALNTTKG